MRRIAIIPARGGSKRIPQKNIKNFCGKPIIEYPIKALNESKLFDKIHVSTDNERIADLVRSLDLDIDFYRPNELSDDQTPIMPVIKYVIEEYKKRKEVFDEIWIVLPCSPMIKSADLLQASFMFKKTDNSKSLMAVAEYAVPIEWAYEINENGVLSPINKGSFAIRSQDIKKKFYDAGMFYIHSKSTIAKVHSGGSDENIMPFIIPKARAIDIDSHEDWDLAEKLFKIMKQ